MMLLMSKSYANSPNNWTFNGPSKDPDKTSQYNFDNSIYTHFNTVQTITSDPNGNRKGNIGETVLYKNVSTYKFEVETASPSGTVWQEVGSGGGGGSGTVGIGTTGLLAVYTGSTTVGPSPNPTNCSPGNYPLGIDGSGNAENCTAGGSGTVTNVATSSPITGGAITTTGTIGITQSATATDGYLSSTDWNTFNNKISGQWITYGQSGNVGIGTKDSVGIGTTLGSAKLAIVGGNLGIGTWNPVQDLEVNGIAKFNSIVSPNANVGIGTYNLMAFGKGDSVSNIRATAPGSFALGRSTGTTVASENNILANNEGSIAAGYANSTTISAQHSKGLITTTAVGATALGAAFGDQSDPNSNSATLSATGQGSFAQGQVQAINTNGASIAWLGLLTATGHGCMAHGYAAGGTVECTGNGNFATGYAHLGSGAGASPTIQASGNGAVAFGDASAHDAVLLASGNGSLAGGSATTTLQATGTGSVALGTNVQATDTATIAIGSSIINNIPSSFQVGFSTAKPTLYAGVTNVGIGTDMVNATGKLVVFGGNVGIGTVTPRGPLDMGAATQPIYMFGIKATTGTRYLCIDNVGAISSSAVACSGT